MHREVKSHCRPARSPSYRKFQAQHIARNQTDCLEQNTGCNRTCHAFAIDILRIRYTITSPAMMPSTRYIDCCREAGLTPPRSWNSPPHSPPPHRRAAFHSAGLRRGKVNTVPQITANTEYASSSPIPTGITYGIFSRKQIGVSNTPIPCLGAKRK